MAEPSVSEAISNLKEVMDNLALWHDVELDFTRDSAFEIYAYVRCKDDTKIEDLLEINRILSNHGFDETDNHQLPGAEWQYEWSEDNY